MNDTYSISMTLHSPRERGGLREMELNEQIIWDDGHTTPEGFKWNGASAPFGRQRAIIASCRHDEDYDKIVTYIARVGGYSKIGPAAKRFIKEMKDNADRRFRLNMRKYDFQHQFLCWIFYLAVRLPFIGGGKAIRDAVKQKETKQ